MGRRIGASKDEPKLPKLIVDAYGKPYYHVPIFLPHIWNAVHRYFAKEVDLND